MHLTPFDYQLAFLLGLSRNGYNGYYNDNSPIFEFLLIKSAFAITEERLTPEERKDFQNKDMKLI